MDNLIQFVPENLLIVIAVLCGVGYFLKSTPKIADWIIPWILCILGILFAIAFNGFSPLAIAQGIVCALCSIGTHQCIKQTTTKDCGNFTTKE